MFVFLETLYGICLNFHFYTSTTVIDRLLSTCIGRMVLFSIDFVIVWRKWLLRCFFQIINTRLIYYTYRNNPYIIHQYIIIPLLSYINLINNTRIGAIDVLNEDMPRRTSCAVSCFLFMCTGAFEL